MADPTPEGALSPESDSFQSEEFSSDNHTISIPLGRQSQVALDPQQLMDTKVSGDNLQIQVLLTLPSGEQELLPEVQVKCFEGDGSVLFSSIVGELLACRYDVHNCRLLYYSPEQKLHVFCGFVGQPSDSLIPYAALDNNRLTLKIKSPSMAPAAPSTQPPPTELDEEEKSDEVYIPGMNGSLPPPPILGQTASIKPRQPTSSQQPVNIGSTPPFVIPGEDASKQQLSQSQLDYIQSVLPQSAGILPETNLQQEINNIGKITKRTKERRIGEIIEKVSLWRKLYNGIPDGRGNIVRFSLEDAANKVGISKKSLDDYLLQMRFGRKFNFDFNKHRQDKVGLLRSFVRKMKAKEKEGKDKRKHKSSRKPRGSKKEIKEEDYNNEGPPLDQLLERDDHLPEGFDSQQLSASAFQRVMPSRKSRKKKRKGRRDESSDQEDDMIDDSQPAPHKQRGFLRTTTHEEESLSFANPSQEPILNQLKVAENSLYSNLGEMSSFPDFYKQKVTDSMNSFDFMKNQRMPKPSQEASQNSLKFLGLDDKTFDFHPNPGASFPHH